MGHTDHTRLLALWNHSCGSGQHLWHGPTLEDAATAWRELTAKGEEADLTAWGRGIIATHNEMRWKFGVPKSTFACPMCGQETPHQHSAESAAFYRENEAHMQRVMERRWEEISARIASITGTPEERA